MNRALGPLAGRRQTPLSPAQQRVLDRLQEQPEPTSLAALVRATGLHENTLRSHLEGLQRGGQVRRHRAAASGRGRPAWLYESTDREPGSEYAGLAAALAAGISSSSPDPSAIGRTAGRAWGHELARQRGAHPMAAPDARHEVLLLLDELGFAPDPVDDPDGIVRLTRCPLLEAAHRNPEVVCAVHLGIVQGALAEHGADADGGSLEPFAEPGACRLRLPL